MQVVVSVPSGPRAAHVCAMGPRRQLGVGGTRFGASAGSRSPHIKGPKTYGSRRSCDLPSVGSPDRSPNSFGRNTPASVRSLRKARYAKLVAEVLRSRRTIWPKAGRRNLPEGPNFRAIPDLRGRGHLRTSLSLAKCVEFINPPTLIACSPADAWNARRGVMSS